MPEPVSLELSSPATEVDGPTGVAVVDEAGAVEFEEGGPVVEVKSDIVVVVDPPAVVVTLADVVVVVDPPAVVLGVESMVVVVVVELVVVVVALVVVVGAEVVVVVEELVVVVVGARTVNGHGELANTPPNRSIS